MGPEELAYWLAELDIAHAVPRHQLLRIIAALRAALAEHQPKPAEGIPDDKHE
jgi:hypothetical protein